jgi:hypothetical protein
MVPRVFYSDKLNDIQRRMEELSALNSSIHQLEMTALTKRMDELLYKEEK